MRKKLLYSIISIILILIIISASKYNETSNKITPNTSQNSSNKILKIKYILTFNNLSNGTPNENINITHFLKEKLENLSSS